MPIMHVATWKIWCAWLTALCVFAQTFGFGAGGFLCLGCPGSGLVSFTTSPCEVTAVACCDDDLVHQAIPPVHRHEKSDSDHDDAGCFIVATGCGCLDLYIPPQPAAISVAKSSATHEVATATLMVWSIALSAQLPQLRALCLPDDAVPIVSRQLLPSSRHTVLRL